MKKILFFALLLIVAQPLFGLRGMCYTFGRDPRSPSPYNYQEKYYIDCDCDCSHTLEFCKECGHYHDPEKQIIVSQKEQLSAKGNAGITPPPTIKAALSYLVARSKQTKKNF